MKEYKKRARQVLKRHYLKMLTLLIIAAMLGTNFGGMVDVLQIKTTSSSEGTIISVFSSIFQGDMEGAYDKAMGNKESIQNDRDFKIGGLEIGHQRGVFSDVINSYASGSMFASAASVLLNLTGSPTVSSIIFMILALIFFAFVSIFVSEIYNVMYTRVFLECRIYDKVGINSLTYLFRVKRWGKASLAYLRYNVCLFLWMLTIVGAFIKPFSYACVRYILAENPDISGKEAIQLSRKMMKGHKWDLFVLNLSFIGWDLLSVLTFGLLAIFFVAPYKEATRAEFYVHVRKLSKERGVPGTNLLNDTYLYEVAQKSDIDIEYMDVIAIMDRPGIELKQPSKIRAFFQDVFGIVLRYDREEMLYRKDMSEKAGVETYKSIVRGEAYPYRLNPLKSHRTRRSLEHQLYMRHYSIPSLILIFFSFCFVGWLWEVSLHIITDGEFVNRGVLHGPWLPIYGVGAILILVVLNVFRKNPLKEFIAAIILCGGIEYFGSWFLEMTHDGTRWWDYTGYFLNINGRICAEGLLVFGLAGIAAVYFIAPMLDNNFTRIDRNVKNALCYVLLIAFIIDLIYSHFVPNVGKGITDYAMNAVNSLVGLI